MSERSCTHRAGRGQATYKGIAARVLIVEDSEAIREMVSEALTDAGYVSEARADGTGLETALEGFRPDLVVLDVMLPGRDGFELIDVVRDWGESGIVLLTARDGLPDRLRGLDGGADDYVVKPFELAELLSRVGAVLRRRGRLPSVVQFGDLALDLDAGVASRAGKPLALTGTELRLLAFLVEQRGRIVSTGQILNAVWGYDAYDANLVHVHVSGLRRKLEAHGPRVLCTVRGIGYRLQPVRP
ncbi:response regulator transcription factor [Mycobacterium shigaense]|uniref:response regulator transcription factor n=1 Tax=Mycobacterium shigaense TaxID=722731 RepID=UPI000E579113|nr:response regulator transcription factor [Mycobacterium shigaense]MEA1124601.1 response regulator transcription factor [Mycobacterium shigaense]